MASPSFKKRHFTQRCGERKSKGWRVDVLVKTPSCAVSRRIVSFSSRHGRSSWPSGRACGSILDGNRKIPFYSWSAIGNNPVNPTSEVTKYRRTLYMALALPCQPAGEPSRMCFTPYSSFLGVPNGCFWQKSPQPLGSGVIWLVKTDQ
jgi:hypothetical protein